MSATSQILKFQCKGQNYQFKSFPLVLAACRPESLHQNSSTSGSKTEKAGHTHRNLPRRYFDHGSNQGSAKVPHESTCSGMRVFGHQAKPREVCLDTNTNDRISKFSHKLGEHDNISTRQQTVEGEERMQVPVQQEMCYSSRSGSHDRLTLINDPSCECHSCPLLTLRHRILLISAGNYDHQTAVTEEAKEDLIWWMNNF